MIKKIGLAALLALFAFPIAACEDDSDVEDAVEDAADDVEDAAEDTADDIEDATDGQ